MSTPIPEWARRAAKEAVKGAPKVNFPRWGHNGLVSAIELSDTEEAIARALMAEREACAVAAEKCGSRAEQFMKERLESHSIDFQRFAEGCASAASAIRDRSKT